MNRGNMDKLKEYSLYVIEITYKGMTDFSPVKIKGINKY